MGPADADQVRIAILQLPEGLSQGPGRRQHLLRHAQHRRDVEGGGIGVVAGLGRVHLVVGVEGHAPLCRQMGDDLIDVHVGLGAAAGLPDHQGKLLIPLPRPDLPAHGGDGVSLLLCQLTTVGVGPGTGLF